MHIKFNSLIHYVYARNVINARARFMSVIEKCQILGVQGTYIIYVYIVVHVYVSLKIVLFE